MWPNLEIHAQFNLKWGGEANLCIKSTKSPLKKAFLQTPWGHLEKMKKSAPFENPPPMTSHSKQKRCSLCGWKGIKMCSFCGLLIWSLKCTVFGRKSKIVVQKGVHGKHGTLGTQKMELIFWENTKAHGPILELEAHGPIRDILFATILGGLMCKYTSVRKIVR